MSLDQTGEKSELYRYVYALRVEMFSNIFVFIIAEVWSPRIAWFFLFWLENVLYTNENKTSLSAKTHRLFACLFSLSIKIFLFVAGLSKAKMSWTLILTFGLGKFMGTSHDRLFITTRVFFCSIWIFFRVKIGFFENR